MSLFKKVEISVESIMSTFTETIKNLHAHASNMDAKAVRHDAEITTAATSKAVAEGEAVKARAIAEKLNSIVQ